MKAIVISDGWQSVFQAKVNDFLKENKTIISMSYSTNDSKYSVLILYK
jgi:hypothetical protein